MAQKTPKSKEFISTSDDNSDHELIVKQKKSQRRTYEQSEDENEPENKKYKEDIDVGNIPYASLSKAPKKRASQFKVTIMPRKYEKSLTRDDFFYALVDLFDNVDIIVSMESNPHLQYSNYRSNVYFKIFLDLSSSTTVKISSSRIYEIIFKILRSLVGDEQKIPDDYKKISDYDRRPEITLEAVSNRKRAIVWATTDNFPRFTENFEPNEEFSQSYKLHNWAFENRNNKWAMETAFASESRHSLQKLKAVLDDVRNKYHAKHKLKVCELGPFNDWRDEVIIWWNSWVLDGWHHKKPQLLLVSRPNCGKTVFIREVLFREGQPDAVPNEAILIPERAGSSYHVSQFAWSKANPNIHVVVFNDEYEMRHYNIELLKVILQGGIFPLSIKYKTAHEDFCLRIPMIFVSNRLLPKSDEALGLEERFHVIAIPKNFQPFSHQDKSPYRQMFLDLLMAKNKAPCIKTEPDANPLAQLNPSSTLFHDAPISENSGLSGNSQLNSNPPLNSDTELSISHQSNSINIDDELSYEDNQLIFTSSSLETSKKGRETFYKGLEQVCSSMDSIHLSQHGLENKID